MSTKLKTITSVEEFRRLYYPDEEPTLDYFDGVGPDREPDKDAEEDASPDPLDRFGRVLRRDR